MPEAKGVERALIVLTSVRLARERSRIGPLRGLGATCLRRFEKRENLPGRACFVRSTADVGILRIEFPDDGALDSCYFRVISKVPIHATLWGMKKLIFASLLLLVVASPAFAAGRHHHRHHHHHHHA